MHLSIYAYVHMSILVCVYTNTRFAQVIYFSLVISELHCIKLLQCSSKIREQRIRVPKAYTNVYECCHMHINTSTYMYVQPLLLIALPYLYVALCGTTREMVK